MQQSKRDESMEEVAVVDRPVDTDAVGIFDVAGFYVKTFRAHLPLALAPLPACFAM